MDATAWLNDGILSFNQAERVSVSGKMNLFRLMSVFPPNRLDPDSRFMGKFSDNKRRRANNKSG